MTENEALIFFENFIDILKINGEEQIQKNDYCKASNIAINVIKENQKYKELGTVEELRLAKEKQTPKKPNDEIKTIPVLDENGAYVDADTYVYLFCPVCGNQVGIDDCVDNYCNNCGQNIVKDVQN